MRCFWFKYRGNINSINSEPASVMVIRIQIGYRPECAWIIYQWTLSNQQSINQSINKIGLDQKSLLTLLSLDSELNVQSNRLSFRWHEETNFIEVR
jgi:hypothetical protein